MLLIGLMAESDGSTFQTPCVALATILAAELDLLVASSSNRASYGSTQDANLCITFGVTAQETPTQNLRDKQIKSSPNACTTRAATTFKPRRWVTVGRRGVVKVTQTPSLVHSPISIPTRPTSTSEHSTAAVRKAHTSYAFTSRTLPSGAVTARCANLPSQYNARELGDEGYLPYCFRRRLRTALISLVLDPELQVSFRHTVT